VVYFSYLGEIFLRFKRTKTWDLLNFFNEDFEVIKNIFWFIFLFSGLRDAKIFVAFDFIFFSIFFAYLTLIQNFHILKNKVKSLIKVIKKI
jgi:hypothetical protein